MVIPGQVRAGTSAGGVLKTGLRGVRLEGGVTLDQALVRNRRTCRPDAKGDGRAGDPCEALSTDAGPTLALCRSGAEQSVVGMKAL